MITIWIKSKLENVISEAFTANTPNICGACERDINYEKFGDPVNEITKAVREFVLTEFENYITKYENSLRAIPGSDTLNFIHENLKKILEG